VIERNDFTPIDPPTARGAWGSIFCRTVRFLVCIERYDMNNEYDPLAADLQAFSEARDAANRSQGRARNEQQDLDVRLLAEAPAAFAELRSKLAERVNRLASNYGEHNVECHSIGNTVTIGLGILEANVQLQPGRPSDAFGPILPSVTLRLSRTSQTIGFDAMPRGMSNYRAPAARSEEFRLRLTEGGRSWITASGAKSSAELAEHILAELVEYFKRYQPQ
jgi:hypothetical protein